MLIPSILPGSLSLPAGVATQFVDSGLAYHFAIAGLPFLSAAREDRVMVRRTADYKKEQVDNTGSAGEQSLAGWWYRSQLSWHGGAGQLYLDPTSDSKYSDIRFFDSAGVDVWTQGRATLLPDVSSTTYGAGSQAVSYTAGGFDCALLVGGATPLVVRADGSADSSSSGSWGFSPAPSAAATNGTSLFVGSSAGVYTAACSSTAPTSWTSIWNAGQAVGAMGWVKQRLVAGIGPSIYELVGAGPTLPTAKYTHPNTNWQWSGIAESGSAIYAAGYAGASGSIFLFSLDTSGTMPVLTTGRVAAEFPIGEFPTSLLGYLGGYLIIGTNKGVRVAAVGGDGTLTYGPLIVESTAPVYALAARDRFVWASASGAIDAGKSGAWRIDLGLDVSDGGLRQAYATDLYSSTSSGTVKALAFLGSTNRLLFADQGNVFWAHRTNKRPSGWLTTSRVRHNTLEPKLFKLIRVRGPALQGPLGISTIDANGSETPLVTLTGDPGEEDVKISSPTSAQEFLSLKFTLNRSLTALQLGAEMTGFQLKSLPGAARKRLLSLPLLCFDKETDPNGVRWGYDGAALDRLEQLEAAEDAGNTVLLQDLVTDRAYECTIEEIAFQQLSPPTGREGWGGYLTVTLRTV